MRFAIWWCARLPEDYAGDGSAATRELDKLFQGARQPLNTKQ